MSVSTLSQGLLVSATHKVNNRYFEILVHSGVASQKRQAGIYFKKWKWGIRSGRSHISSSVPSLSLENGRGAWGGVVRRERGKGKAHTLRIVPWLQKSSQGQVHSAKVKVEKRNRSSDSGCNFICAFMPYVLHTRHLCTELCSDLGKSLPAGSLSES